MNYICMKLYMYYVIQLHEDMHVVRNIFERRHTWLQNLGSGVLMIWVGGTSLHQRLFRSSRRHIDLNTMLLVVGCCSRLQKSICPYDCDSNQYSELVLAAKNQSSLCFFAYTTVDGVSNNCSTEIHKSLRSIWRLWSILPVRSTRGAK